MAHPKRVKKSHITIHSLHWRRDKSTFCKILTVSSISRHLHLQHWLCMQFCTVPCLTQSLRNCSFCCQGYKRSESLTFPTLSVSGPSVVVWRWCKWQMQQMCKAPSKHKHSNDATTMTICISCCSEKELALQTSVFSISWRWSIYLSPSPNSFDKTNVSRSISRPTQQHSFV